MPCSGCLVLHGWSEPQFKKKHLSFGFCHLEGCGCVFIYSDKKVFF